MFIARDFIICLLFLTCGSFINGRRLAPFIKRCKANDPNFKACCMESAKEAVPLILKVSTWRNSKYL
ncbi:hypothetical protein JTB14_023927 [Gonioctena quinquepunctata]|nr:hypothetical protein JTB14_023927 [Gonioctena quinquepunctata]